MVIYAYVYLLLFWSGIPLLSKFSRQTPPPSQSATTLHSRLELVIYEINEPVKDPDTFIHIQIDLRTFRMSHRQDSRYPMCIPLCASNRYKYLHFYSNFVQHCRHRNEILHSLLRKGIVRIKQYRSKCRRTANKLSSKSFASFTFITFIRRLTSSVGSEAGAMVSSASDELVFRYRQTC